MSQSGSADVLFVETAFSKSLLSREEADRILERARSSGRSASDLLVDEGLITQRTCDAIAQDVERSAQAKTLASPASPPSSAGDAKPDMFQFSEAGGESRTAVHPTGSEGDGDETITETPMPERLGDYEVLQKLGEGGMGAVYRGEDTKLGRIVALKVLAPHYAKDRLAKDRFLREARVSASINHPNVITVHGVGEQEGLLYMALEYLDGGDAADLIDRHPGGVPERRALEVIRDCARGLVAIEKAGLVHRDIKPANIFITSDGVAKLADMGLARSQGGDDRMTMTGAIVGTPAYMAPEQARGNKELDIRTDIYALGAALYALTTSAPPFRGTSAWVVVSNVLSEPVPDPRQSRPGLTQRLSTLVCKALAKEPDDRFGTASEFLAAIEEALAHSSGAVAPPASGASVGAGRPVSGRRISKSGAASRAGSRGSEATLETPSSAPRSSSEVRRAPTERPVILRPPPPQRSPLALVVGAGVVMAVALGGYAYSTSGAGDAVADGGTADAGKTDADSTSALLEPEGTEPEVHEPTPDDPTDLQDEPDPLPLIVPNDPPQDPPPLDEPPGEPPPRRVKPRRPPQNRLPNGWRRNPSIPPVLRAKPRGTAKVGFRNDRAGVWPGGTDWGGMSLTDRSRRSLPRGPRGGGAFEALLVSFDLRADVDANRTKDPAWLRARGHEVGPQPGFYAHLGLRSGSGELKALTQIEEALWVTLLFEQRADGELDVHGMLRVANDTRPRERLAAGRGVARLTAFQFSVRPGEPLQIELALNQSDWVLQIATRQRGLVFERGPWSAARGAEISRRTLRRGLQVFGELGNWSDGYGWGHLRTEITTDAFAVEDDRLVRYQEPEPERQPKTEPTSRVDPPQPSGGWDDGRRPPPPPGGPPPGGRPPPPPPGGRRPPPR